MHGYTFSSRALRSEVCVSHLFAPLVRPASKARAFSAALPPSKPFRGTHPLQRIREHPIPRVGLKPVNTPLRNHFSHGINKHIESSVWLVGRLCATLVARPASKVYSRKSGKSAPPRGPHSGTKLLEGFKR
jgi:hypothetical protein